MHCFYNENSNATIFKKYEVWYSVLYTQCIPFILNLVVLVSACRMLKKQFSVTYMLLGNLAVTDLLPTIPVFTKLLTQYLDAQTDCECFVVGLIALDKYFYLMHGLVYPKYVTKRKCLTGLSFIWIINLIVGFLPVFGIHNKLEEGSECSALLVLNLEQSAMRMVLGLIPIIITIILYLKVLRLVFTRINLLNKSQTNVSTIPTGNDMSLRVFKGSSNSIDKKEDQPSNKTNFKKLKAISIVALTCGSFLITWFPYYCCCLYFQVNCLHSINDTCKELMTRTVTITVNLGTLNSFLNPVIYLWWHKKFRKYIRAACMKSFCWKCWNSLTKSNREESVTTSSTSTVQNSINK